MGHLLLLSFLKAAEVERRDRKERGDDLAGRGCSGRAPRPPDPEMVAKPRRREFTAEQKLRILEETDRCRKPGAIGRNHRLPVDLRTGHSGTGRSGAQGCKTMR